MAAYDDDFPMRAAELDESGAEALLTGRAHDFPGDLPAEWADVARTLEPLRAAPVSAPPRPELLDRMQEATTRRRRAPATVWRRPRMALAGLAGAVVVVAGFGGLAAADALPSGIQRFVSDTLDHVGISVPSPADHGGSPPPGPSQGSGHDANGGGDAKSTGVSTPAHPDGAPSSTDPSSGTAEAGGSAPTTEGSSTDGPTSKGSSATKPSAPGATNPGNTAPRGSSPTAPGQTGDHGNHPATPPGATNPNKSSNAKSQKTLGTPATTSAATPGSANRTRGGNPNAGGGNPNAGGANSHGAGGGGPPATTGNGTPIPRGQGKATGRP